MSSPTECPSLEALEEHVERARRTPPGVSHESDDPAHAPTSTNTSERTPHALKSTR